MALWLCLLLRSAPLKHMRFRLFLSRRIRCMMLFPGIRAAAAQLLYYLLTHDSIVFTDWLLFSVTRCLPAAPLPFVQEPAQRAVVLLNQPPDRSRGEQHEHGFNRRAKTRTAVVIDALRESQGDEAVDK